MNYKITKKKAGGLKKPAPNQKGLKKLPEEVRNTMGYMKDGGIKLTAAQKKKMEGMTEKEKAEYLRDLKAKRPDTLSLDRKNLAKDGGLKASKGALKGLGTLTNTDSEGNIIGATNIMQQATEKMKEKKKMGGKKKKKMSYMKKGRNKKRGGGMAKMNDMYKTGGFIRPTFDIDKDVCCE